MREVEVTVAGVNDLGERWWDEPAVLERLIESARVRGLNTSGNSLRAVIYVCGDEIKTNPDPEHRRMFRDGAVGLLALGREEGILSDADYTEQCIYIRISYLRNARQGPEWSQAEMSQIVDLFEAWLPFDTARAREKAEDWRRLPLEEIQRLRQAKKYLKLMEDGVRFATGAQADRLRAWYDLLPQLP